MISSNNENHKITKKIIKIIKLNMNKNIKWIYGFKDKLIIFIYYLKLFYQTYLIYLITWIKLWNQFKLLSWFTT